MKRVSVDSSQTHIDSEETKSRHQNLLQDYLVLQKEVVTKKKKLQATKQRRETLLAEVRFLRRRCNYFLELKSNTAELEQQVDHLQEEQRLINSLVGDKRFGKKKISWQDPVVALCKLGDFITC